jgi:hypothetical protein
MSVGDDLVWLEALAGRAPHDAGEVGASASADEARALRASILKQAADPVAVVAQIDSARESQLIARARAQGLLTQCSAQQRHYTAQAVQWWRRLFGSRGTLAATIAAALVLVVAGELLRFANVEVAPQRGDSHAVVRISAEHPRTLRRQISAELKAQGVHVSEYEQLGRAGLDADLPLPLSPQLRQVLQRHHLPIPEDGVLVVEIE